MRDSLTIAHIYPREMDTYGDTGNVVALIDRLQWRGVDAELVRIGLGEPFDFREADIVFGGGGQDRAQATVSEDLQGRRDNLLAAAAEGVVMLVVCGTYQLFGRRFLTCDGKTIPGIGLFDLETHGSDLRMIGEIVVESPFFGPLVGFENHSGKTRLDPGQSFIGTVIRGHGNDGESGCEGAVTNNVFGTYLHGPILPKNPRFADYLLKLALERRWGFVELPELDDTLEMLAAENAAYRHLPRRHRARDIRILEQRVSAPLHRHIH